VRRRWMDTVLGAGPSACSQDFRHDLRLDTLATEGQLDLSDSVCLWQEFEWVALQVASDGVVGEVVDDHAESLTEEHHVPTAVLVSPWEGTDGLLDESERGLRKIEGDDQARPSAARETTDRDLARDGALSLGSLHAA